VLFIHSISVASEQTILMDIKSTRSTTDLKSTNIESLALPLKNTTKTSLIEKNANIDIVSDSVEIKNVISDEDDEQEKQKTFGHDLHDQRLFQSEKEQQSFLQSQIRLIQKCDGYGDAENWLKHVFEKFDSLQLTTNERNDLVPEILTGDALIWYVKQQKHMITFISFIKHFLQYYGLKEVVQEQSTRFILSSGQAKLVENSDYKDIVIDSLRNQMLTNSLEKLPKFAGKSKQNVSKWLREINQAMHIFKLTDDEKLFFISSCLEADARDWFFDNNHLFSTWSLFIQKLSDTFESSGKADISFNRLRHYEQGLTQDVRSYYFEIMKSCKEANPIMDQATKLQYLKDGLKSSLRFDVLLKNSHTPEEFLEYAQKMEELKSLDEKQEVFVYTASKSPQFPLTSNTNIRRLGLSQPTRPTISQQTNTHSTPYGNNSNYTNPSNRHTNIIISQDQRDYHIPKPPYRCYKCGGTDHFINDCPHFQ
jgi:uncharacterized protein YbgA (DUF1722 family)